MASLEGRKIFVWKEIEVSTIQETKHHAGFVSLLAVGTDEAEARREVVHRLRENFHASAAEAEGLAAAEPDVWHVETEPVFEI